MSVAPGNQRQCPTRQDGRVALFTHRVTEPECQSRQRGMFHRCFTCAHNNTWVARHGLPAQAEEAAPEVAAAAPPPPSPGAAGEASKALVRVR